MGFSQSSLGVTGKSSDAVLAALSLRPTGEHEDFPESPFVATTLPSGWFLVVADRAEHEIISDDVLQRLSAGCEVVTCFVEEHVMVSGASGWRDGIRIWRVTHDAQIAFDHLATDAELPTAYPAIRDRLLAEQQNAG